MASFMLYVIVALVALIAMICARIAYVGYTDGLGWLARFGRHDAMVRVPCKECDGYGIRFYGGGKMRNITPDIRDRKKGVWAWGNPLGNKVACLKCKGHGFNWVAKSASNTHAWQR